MQPTIDPSQRSQVSTPAAPQKSTTKSKVNTTPTNATSKKTNNVLSVLANPISAAKILYRSAKFDSLISEKDKLCTHLKSLSSSIEKQISNGSINESDLKKFYKCRSDLRKCLEKFEVNKTVFSNKVFTDKKTSDQRTEIDSSIKSIKGSLSDSDKVFEKLPDSVFSSVDPAIFLNRTQMKAYQGVMTHEQAKELLKDLKPGSAFYHLDRGQMYLSVKNSDSNYSHVTTSDPIPKNLRFVTSENMRSIFELSILPKFINKRTYFDTMSLKEAEKTLKNADTTNTKNPAVLYYSETQKQLVLSVRHLSGGTTVTTHYRLTIPVDNEGNLSLSEKDIYNQITMKGFPGDRITLLQKPASP